MGNYFINVNKYRDVIAVCDKIENIFARYNYQKCDNPSQADVAISVGGDGTFIDTANKCMQADIIGINKGTLGYLAEIEESNVETAIMDYINGNYFIEKRMRIACFKNDISTYNEKFVASALNDIVLSKRQSSIIDVEIVVDNVQVTRYHADGVIVSTPTGTTGYAFSCGAPIIDPNSEMMIITPIAPHTIMNRSICVSANSDIKIELVEAREHFRYDKGCNLDIDGERLYDNSVAVRESVHIKKLEDNYNKIVKFKKTSFLDRIFEKMK